jgi:hypothetical protein
MAKLSKFDSWKKVTEVRKAVKCPIDKTDLFAPLRETSVYKDSIALGWVELNAQWEVRQEGERYQGERQGNLRFKHDKFEKVYRINGNGKLWQEARSGKAERISLEYDHDEKWLKQCLTLKDYEDRVQYLIKRLLWSDGFINSAELRNAEGGIEIIKRKLDEDADNVKKLTTVPPSLKSDYDYQKALADVGLF